MLHRSAPLSSNSDRFGSVSASSVVVRVGALSIVLAALVACSSNNDDEAVEDLNGSPTGSPADDPSGGNVPDGSGDDPTMEPVAPTSLINRDNHVALLAEVFDLYVGRPYADKVVDIAAKVRGRALAGLVLSVTACDNGGTATIVSEGRVAFDDCLLGDAVFDGADERPFNPFGDHLVAEELVVDRLPVVRLELDGDMRRLASSTNSDSIGVWETDRATIRWTTSEGVIAVEQATSTFAFGGAGADKDEEPIYSGHLSGTFVFHSPLTGDRPIRAETPVGFAYPVDFPNGPFGAEGDFTVGKLMLTAEDDSTLVLDAATGDDTTVSIEIGDGSEPERFIQPWSLWHERLRFDPPGE